MTTDYRKFTSIKGNDIGARRLNFIISKCQNYFSQKPINEIEVIDIGCGASPITRPIAALGFKTLGIDIDPMRIKHCRKTLANLPDLQPNLTFELKNIYDFDSKKKFDIIISSEVLEHQDNPISFLGKLNEILAPDGIILITIPNGYGTYENIERIHKFLKKTKLTAIIMNRIKRILNFLGLFRRGIPIADTSGCTIHCPHVQYFSLAEFKKILTEVNLTFIEKKNGHFLLDSFPCDIFYRMNKNLIFLDGRVADLLPGFLVNSWFFVCKRKSI